MVMVRKMGYASVVPLFLLICLFLWHSPADAAPKSYVVYLGSHSHGPEPTLEDFKRATDRHHEFLGSFLGSKEKAKDVITQSYRKHINGFAANLEEEEAAQISKHPDVISVFPNVARKRLTTRSWSFLGLENKNGDIPKDSLWAKSRMGEDVIIGVIDSGVYPESPSFSDEGMGPVPSRWKGFCQKEKVNGVRCNRKLIGARYFYKHSAPDYNQYWPPSARDYDGHGTHCLSTAGGRYVPGANFFGYANGTAKGGAPNARLASYNNGDCNDADTLAAFDAAIHDGVDVISTSMAGTNNTKLLVDAISIGALHAISKGIIVTAAAGNDGPLPGLVENQFPWVFTIGASLLDREFINYIKLGNNMTIEGKSLSNQALPRDKYYPFITGRDARLPNATVQDGDWCTSSALDPEKVRGKVVLCWLGSYFDVGSDVREVGAAGMVLVSPLDMKFFNPSYAHTLPASWLNYSDGLTVKNYIESTKSPVVSITETIQIDGVTPAPRVAYFSSRGPSSMNNSILKPDVIAPGQNILAAWNLDGRANTYDLLDTRKVLYKIEEGTSFSSPHAAGLAASLKALYPDWSPSAIKSAIMTTASTRDNMKEPLKDHNLTEATLFAYGSGHINPNRAADPGLVYDLSTSDYLNFLCASGLSSTQVSKYYENYTCPPKPIELHNLNYPSISVENVSVSTSISVTRTLKNVGTPGTYKVRVQPPLGVSVVLEPRILHFQKVGEEKTFQVTLKLKKAYAQLCKEYVFGTLTWSDGKHCVTSPIVVKAKTNLH